METKTRARRTFYRTNNPEKKRKRSTALQAILEIDFIDLPQDIRHVFQTWKDQPSRLWNLHEAQVGTWQYFGKSIETVAIEAYLVIRHLSLRRRVDTVRWRFYATLFYDLARLLGNGQEHMSDALYQELRTALSRSREITDADEAVIVDKNLRSWIAAGSRYHRICLRLGRGALFLLPHVLDKV